MNRIATYFFRGILIVVPVAITIYILLLTFEWLDGILKIEYPGVGVAILLVTITALGYLASFFLTKPLFEYFEKLILKIPFIGLMYTSFKDMVAAIVGEKKKFDKPVIVQLDSEGSVFKVGFITQEDMDIKGLENMVSVYLPHSYAFSGNQFLVPRNRIKPLDVQGQTAMKFIVSGGVSGFGES